MKSLRWRTRAVVLLILAAGLGWAINNARPAPLQPPVPPPAAGIVQVPAAPAPGLTVADVSGPLTTVLSDERTADRADTEAWVAEGYSNDLQVLVNITGDADGTNPLNVDARVLSTDAYAYLDANGDGLQPGWQAQYAQLRTDLNLLAANCGLAPVPAPPDSGLSAKPDTALPWQPPAQPASAACTATTTNSASSTGAHSQSVKTTCGTASVTHKTSVSKTGAVTNTTTTSG